MVQWQHEQVKTGKMPYKAILRRIMAVFGIDQYHMPSI